MTERARIYPVFLPHQGCPFQCVYCNQHAVAGIGSTPSARTSSEGSSGNIATDSPEVQFRMSFPNLLREAIITRKPGEIAFYGGTFTALSVETIRAMLDTVKPAVEKGVLTGIRFSTRPDCVTPEICALLSAYPVRTVELGVQSFSDEVLHESRRGYIASAVHQAAGLIRQHGWALGVQLMPGLPGDTFELFMKSIADTVALEPDLIRIYPTLVLRDTPLARWLDEGLFTPLDLDAALSWCAAAYKVLLRANIPVARMGLHAYPELLKPGCIVAGPYHPAFGYLVRVRHWRDLVDGLLEAGGVAESSRVILVVPERQLSEAIGPGRSNIFHWRQRWGLADLRARGENGWTPYRFELMNR